MRLYLQLRLITDTAGVNFCFKLAEPKGKYIFEHLILTYACHKPTED